jgi:hypothetical protein
VWTWLVPLILIVCDVEEWRNGDMRVVQRLQPRSLKNELGPGSGHEDLASLHGIDPGDGSRCDDDDDDGWEQRKDSCCTSAGQIDGGHLQLAMAISCGVAALLDSR